MSSRTIYFELAETTDERFDRPIEWMLIGAMLFAPLAVGAVQAWSEWVVLLLAAAMVGTLGAKLLVRPDVRFVRSWTYLPIAVVLGLGVIQVLPLSPGILRLISPHTFDILASLRQTAGISDPAGSISFYPEGTIRNLRILIAISAIYVVAINVVHRLEQVRRMLTWMTIIGAAIALIGMTHVILGATRVYGLLGDRLGPWLTGPFINRNHFGQFLNMCLGAAAGLLLMRMDEEQGASSRSRGRSRHGSGDVPADMWVWAGAAIVIAIGVFMSLSRGAILSLLISAGIAGIALARRGVAARLWALLPVAWLVLLVVVFFGFDRIAGRFVQVTDTQTASVGGRLTIVRDILRAAKSAPILGYGLGSFETVYPMFDSSQSATLATHAENEYAQALFEGGAIELAMVLLLLGMVVGAYLRCVRRISSPMAMPAVGLGMGIFAVAIQSASDFGQHLPANAIATAVAIAMLMNLSAATRRTDAQASEPEPERRAIGLRRAVMVAVVIVFALTIFDGFSATAAEQHWMEAQRIEPILRNRDWTGDEQDFVQLLVAAKQASAGRPGDVQYRYWLNFYRFRYISQERDEQTGQILFDEQRLKWAGEIVEDVLDSVRIAPAYGPNYTLAGLIAKNVLQRPGAEKLVRQGFDLSRTDPAAAFEAAMLDAQDGHWDEAMAKFEHAADLAPAYRTEAAMSLAGRLGRADLAMKLAGENPQIVSRVIGALKGSGQDEAAAKAQEALAAMVRAQADDPAADGEALVAAARMATTEHNPERAAKYLDRAVQLDPTRAAWRLELARALAAAGDVTRALSEAQWASRMSAQGADSLVLELRMRASTQPAAGTQ